MANGKEDDSWHSEAFRQSMLDKITDEVNRSGLKAKASLEFAENLFFQRAKNKNHYVRLVNSFINFIRKRTQPQEVDIDGLIDAFEKLEN